jgi:glycosyltransferase involved in cell wall biosynthesis
MNKATIIAAFYNKIDYLKLVLAGLDRQTEKDFELIIADDGSRKDIVEEIKVIQKKHSFPIKHIWQEDNGFRKNKILNKSVLYSESDYLIFIDADCVPHSGFVEGHLNFAQDKSALTGRRVNLSQKITSELLVQNVCEGFLEKKFIRLSLDGIFGESVDVEKGIYIRNKFLMSLFNKKNRGLLGCNFSLFKNDLININGFDERYEAPSIGEDSDVQFRLEISGVQIKSINHAAVQYHLYHKLQERPQHNLILFAEIKKNKVAFTPFGLKK